MTQAMKTKNNEIFQVILDSKVCNHHFKKYNYNVKVKFRKAFRLQS